MPRNREEALRIILSDYESFANLVLSQLDVIEKLIITGKLCLDDNQYDEMLENGEAINKSEIKLSEDVVAAIALYQPIGRKMRQLIACYRITIGLGQIGKLAIDIVGLLRQVENSDLYLAISNFLSKMMSLTADMSRRSMLSFINHDMELVNWTLKSEAIVARFDSKILKKLAKKAGPPPFEKDVLTSCAIIKEIASAIGHIAGHTADIAEASYYAFEGKNIKRNRESNQIQPIAK